MRKGGTTLVGAILAVLIVLQIVSLVRGREELRFLQAREGQVVEQADEVNAALDRLEEAMAQREEGTP